MGFRHLSGCIGQLCLQVFRRLTIQKLLDAGDLLACFIKSKKPNVFILERSKGRSGSQRGMRNYSPLPYVCYIVVDFHLCPQ